MDVQRQNWLADLPMIWDQQEDIARRIADRFPVVMVDYDGTLVDLAADPGRAVLGADARQALADLGDLCMVVVVSDRRLSDLRALVGLDHLHYVASHGFELAGPDWQEIMSDGVQALVSLATLSRMLDPVLEAHPDARLELKPYDIVIHTGALAPEEIDPLLSAIQDAVARVSQVQIVEGRDIIRIEPAVDWGLHHALAGLLERTVGSGERVFPVHIGDDVGDEAAFAFVRGRGLGVAVLGADNRPTHAHAALADPADVTRFLRHLCETLAGRP